MALRCLLFTSDMETAAPICHVLADLAVEAEHCAEVSAAAENISSQPFQIVIVDWDAQPEAAVLLQTARERKISERPLTLAIVSEDAGVPKALQAGANSILRKPILVNPVKDTLKTACDLLRARESASVAAQAAAAGAGAPSSSAAAAAPPQEAILRPGEFMQSTAPPSPTQIDTESEVKKSLEQSTADEVHVLKDLELMAAAVEQEKAAPPPPLEPEERRGLQWYLNQRGAAAAAPAPAAVRPASRQPSGRPDLIGYDRMHSYSSTPAPKAEDRGRESGAFGDPEQEKRAEAELFACIAGESDVARNRVQARPARLGKGVVIGALALAGCAIVAAPQAPWHPQLRTLWGRGRQTVHGWLNPQPVTPAQAPASHENFGRAGDEYKLPAPEAIPDATTDPSQIRVVPFVDPTVKKPNSLGGNAEPNGVPVDGAAPNLSDPAQSGTQGSGVQAQPTPEPGSGSLDNPTPVNQAPHTTPITVLPAAGAASSPAMTSAPAEPAHTDPFKPSPAVAPVRPAPPRNPQRRPASSSPSPSIPSSLKSQMASMTPEASGNKAPETALPSIEPVDVPEATERALLTDQPAMAYPANAKSLQGTVVLQVLIGRDGSVQDAKFLQGSLAFARTAIDGVKQWKFKPYTMNGRAVSVQTKLTLSFKPGQLH